MYGCVYDKKLKKVKNLALFKFYNMCVVRIKCGIFKNATLNIILRKNKFLVERNEIILYIKPLLIFFKFFNVFVEYNDV